MTPKRTYERGDDEMILERLRAGTLRVDHKGRVWSTTRGGALRKKLTLAYDSRGRYLFVRVHFRGRRKAIALARLVWMQHHDRLVPANCEIHHKRGRHHNGIDDLELLGHAEHLAVTYGYPTEWDSPDWDEKTF